MIVQIFILYNLSVLFIGPTLLLVIEIAIPVCIKIQKQPAWFLPLSRSTAVLPPTEESTMDSRVVGTWI